MKRKIITSAACMFCDRVDELVEHILRDCPNAVAVWFLSPLCFRVNAAKNYGWKDWTASLAKLSNEIFDLVLVLIWSIWKDKNAFFWNGSSTYRMEIQSVGVQEMAW